MLVVLSKEIVFKDFEGQSVTLKEGTEAYVDLEESIAYAEGYHFDIERSEFIVIN